MLLKPTILFNDKLAIINIISSSNNTVINISTVTNETLSCSSCGFLNIKGAKRGTSYASQKISIILGKRLLSMGFKFIYIKLKGFGNGRYSSLKGFDSSGLIILNIFDKTLIPFNGCKSSKKRRI